LPDRDRDDIAGEVTKPLRSSINSGPPPDYRVSAEVSLDFELSPLTPTRCSEMLAARSAARRPVAAAAGVDEAFTTAGTNVLSTEEGLMNEYGRKRMSALAMQIRSGPARMAGFDDYD